MEAQARAAWGPGSNRPGQAIEMRPRTAGMGWRGAPPPQGGVGAEAPGMGLEG